MQPLDFDFLKDRYDFELDRKEKLTDSLNLPVGILSGLGGLLALMARSFTYRDPVLTWTFAPFLVVALLASAACLVQLGRAYHRQKYMYLPLLRTLVDWQEENREFLDYVERTGGTTDETDLPSYLRMRIIEAADRNTTNNDERSSLLYWARVWLFAVLTSTAFAGIPYVADQVRVSMPGQEAPSQPAPQPTPQPTPQNTTPQPTPFPANREIREGDRPKPRA